MRNFLLIAVGFLGVASPLSPSVFAQDNQQNADDENKGQEDLDKATELQLNARTLKDLEEVANLCEKALDKGLDDENQKFARKLASSSLYEHAKRLSQAVLGPGRDRRWQLYRHVAIQSLDKSIKHNNDLGEAHALRCRLHMLPGGDRKSALTSAEQLVKIYKDDTKKLSESYVIRGKLVDDPEKSLADFDKAIEIDAKNIEAWESRANHFVLAGKLEEAVESFNKLLAQQKDNLPARITLAEALSNLKRFDEALEQAGKAIEIDAKNSAPYTLRARIHLAQEKTAEAKKDLDEAVKVDPKDMMARLMRGEINLIDNKYDAARKDVKAVLRDRPGLVLGVLLRSRISAAEGQDLKEAKKDTLSRIRFSEAINDIRMLLQHQPDNVDWQLQLSALHSADGQPRRAVKVIDRLIRKDPKSWRALRARADALLTIGEHKRAIEDYEKAIKLNPEQSGMLNNLAWVLSTSPKDELRDGKRAVELARKACEATEYKEAYILSTLASAYAEIGDFETAKKWSAKAVELGPKRLKDQLQKELDSYKEGKKWRELQETEEKPDFKAPPREVVET